MNQFFWCWIRRLVMIAIPTALVCLEWNHPSGFINDVYSGLSPMKSWWKHLHIIQSFLFGGIAVGAIFLTLGNNSVWGAISKVSFWLFAVCYLVFDSTGGIAVGFLIEQALYGTGMDVDTIKKLAQKLYTDPVIGGSGSVYSLTGSWAWLIGVSSAMVAIITDNHHLRSSILLPPMVLLAVSAYSLCVGHYSPYGPIAFFCFAAASVWFEIFHFGPSAYKISTASSE